MADSEKRPSNGDVDAQHLEGANGGGVIEKNDINGNSSAPSSGGVVSDIAHQKLKMSRKLANPLAGIDTAALEQLGEDYCRKHNIGGATEENIRAFRLGAVISSDPSAYTGEGEYGGGGVVFDRLTDNEKNVLRREETHKWSNPWALYSVIIICSLSAAVQGMDETVVNGAQIFYKRAFKINSGSDRDEWLVGLCNSAPYLCCAFIGCWLTEPMNKVFGRKGTVFIACIVSALACFWQAFTNTWYHMFIARFCLGLGIGPKSATTPMFAAECAPPRLRGALVMQWQMWTAFGIMVGYIADLAFYFVPDHGVELGLNWRLMMGSAMIPAVLVCCLIHTCVESPRWYLTKDRHTDAFDAVCRLRFEKVQAARDLFYMHTLLEAEKEINMNGSNSTFARLKEMWSVRRNRNAMIASEIVMFMQQFCGVNVLAYYSSQIFLDAQLSEVSSLGASVGWGVINWLFAIPAIYTIDTFGRRNLLLTTFPLMAIFLLFTGFSFWIPSSESDPNPARIACVALGVYLFAIVYSPGEGPVPFTYSAEAYPLYLRPLGMSLATATTWFFNFVLSVTWPSLLKAFKPQGAFGWYAGWNVVGFFAVLLFMPETKAKTLEELDAVFSVSFRKRMHYGWAQFFYFFRRYVFMGGKNIEAPQEPIADEYLEHYQEKHQLPARQPQPDSTARV
ncbi:mfs sugar transporter [Ophiostoma piceae UAMH 11346]|uniref:Mfs sugar transporter n=1 Tax=Ophiostoma piceae (strain UAMH 11346) TaxID=1262450 RepID=S3CZQ2_OPHP1|nr:mfs sugar transporter [Ophiostoma piceae UAMH 11346]